MVDTKRDLHLVQPPRGCLVPKSHHFPLLVGPTLRWMPHGGALRSCVSGDRWTVGPGAHGHPIPGWRLRLHDHSRCLSGDVPTHDGQVGECVRCEKKMRAFFREIYMVSTRHHKIGPRPKTVETVEWSGFVVPRCSEGLEFRSNIHLYSYSCPLGVLWPTQIEMFPTKLDHQETRDWTNNTNNMLHRYFKQLLNQQTVCVF